MYSFIQTPPSAPPPTCPVFYLQTDSDPPLKELRAALFPQHQDAWVTCLSSQRAWEQIKCKDLFSLFCHKTSQVSADPWVGGYSMKIENGLNDPIFTDQLLSPMSQRAVNPPLRVSILEVPWELQWPSIQLLVSAQDTVSGSRVQALTA